MAAFQSSQNSPPPLLTHAFERHPDPLRRTLIRVTPPSVHDPITEERSTDLHDELPVDHPHFESHVPSNSNTNDARATVMVYNDDDSPTITPPTQLIHAP